MPRVKPGAARWEAWTLPLCYEDFPLWSYILFYFIELYWLKKQASVLDFQTHVVLLALSVIGLYRNRDGWPARTFQFWKYIHCWQRAVNIVVYSKMASVFDQKKLFNGDSTLSWNFLTLSSVLRLTIQIFSVKDLSSFRASRTHLRVPNVKFDFNVWVEV